MTYGCVVTSSLGSRDGPGAPRLNRVPMGVPGELFLVTAYLLEEALLGRRETMAENRAEPKNRGLRQPEPLQANYKDLRGRVRSQKEQK